MEVALQGINRKIKYLEVERQRWFHLERLQAGVAQLVERQPSKLQVAGSSLVSRSLFS